LVFSKYCVHFESNKLALIKSLEVIENEIKKLIKQKPVSVQREPYNVDVLKF